MKKLILSALALTTAAATFAQSPIDAMQLSQTELRGTARFMSMAGAFTALGADLSAINQNPAGIGMYRGSDVGLTLGIDINSNKTSWTGGSDTQTKTTANLNNAGYVGTYNFGAANDYSVSWGFTYNRLYRFNRMYNGNLSGFGNSLTNYIASLTDGVNPEDLWMSDSHGKELFPYDNYSDNAPDWMSILFYNSGMINSETVEDGGDIYETDQYRGMWQNGGVDSNGNRVRATSGAADFLIREKGHADEYDINFGGNVKNVFYWGISVGITDLNWTREYWYAEHLENSLMPVAPAGYQLASHSDTELYSFHRIDGTGANFKVGAILKPINELRIGLAVHTPTYYTLSSTGFGSTMFNMTPAGAGRSFDGEESTPIDSYDFNLNTPWKLMAGVAGVIGGRGILSFDYEYDAFGDMKLKWDDGTDMTYNNDNIKKYYKGTSTIRLGGEFRATPQLSVRAGYSYSTSAAKPELKDANTAYGKSYGEVSTAGQDPSYRVNDDTQYITCGLGYKYQGLYFDLAYVYKHRTSTFNAFTPFTDAYADWSTAPSAKLTDNKSQIVATIGYRF